MNTSHMIRACLTVSGLILACASAAQADTYFMRLKGQRSGEIRGGVTQKGREGQIQVVDVHHAVVSPRDVASGLPTGKRQHKPLELTIPLDRSAPLFYNMVATNETITDLQLHTWVPTIRTATGIGSEVLAYSIRLTNATIASVEEIVKTDAAGANPKTLLKISLTYQRIEWTWNDGGITAMDDWEARY